VFAGDMRTLTALLLERLPQIPGAAAVQAHVGLQWHSGVQWHLGFRAHRGRLDRRTRPVAARPPSRTAPDRRRDRPVAADPDMYVHDRCGKSDGDVARPPNHRAHGNPRPGVHRTFPTATVADQRLVLRPCKSWGRLLDTAGHATGVVPVDLWAPIAEPSG
jgi:hypothetical protein